MIEMTGKMEDDRVCGRSSSGPGASQASSPWMDSGFQRLFFATMDEPSPSDHSIQLMAEDDGQLPGAAGGEVKMARAAGEIPPPCAAASSRPGGARLPALRRKRWQVEVSFLQDNPMPQQEVCTSNLCISPSDSSWLLCFATKLLCLICFKK